MGKEGRYDFDEGSEDELGDGNGSGSHESDSGGTETVDSPSDTKRQEDNSPMDTATSRSSPSTPRDSGEDVQGSTDTPSEESGIPHGGEAEAIRTEETNHPLPEDFSMSSLPVKQRRENVGDYREESLTIKMQEETLDDIHGAKEALDEEFNKSLPKTDVYEIVLIAGANDDLTLLDAAHIIGYGID